MKDHSSFHGMHNSTPNIRLCGNSPVDAFAEALGEVSMMRGHGLCQHSSGGSVHARARSPASDSNTLIDYRLVDARRQYTMRSCAMQ